jgi:type I restriction enzyme S subunit
MECVLKDLIAVSRDGEWGKGEPFDGSVEMLAIRGTDFEDIRFGSIASTPRRHIARRHAERKVLQPWDVIIEVAGGTKNQITGRTVLLRPKLFASSKLPFTCASFSRFIRFNREVCDPEFMFWYLQHLYISGSMHAYHTQHTGVARFQWTTFSEREPLNLPPQPIQRRIAGILSAYDELIEISQQRIKILETMARAIYHEWFVHFRFPGHESIPLVPSPLGEIPEGWEVKKLCEVAEITMGLSPNGDTYNDEGRGTPLINGPVEFGERVTKRVKWTIAPTKICKEGDLIVCVRGSTTGKYVKSDGEYCLGRGVCSLSSKYQCFVDLLFEHELPTLLGQTSGSTFPSWTGPQLRRHPVVHPPLRLLANFEALVKPISAAVLGFSRQSQNLRRTRDLLLPRLLSGQIDVEAIVA